MMKNNTFNSAAATNIYVQIKILQTRWQQYTEEQECAVIAQGVKLNVATNGENYSLVCTKAEFHSNMTIGLSSISSSGSNTLKTDQLVITKKDAKAAHYIYKPSQLFTAEQM